LQVDNTQVPKGLMYLLFTFLSISCLKTILKWSAEEEEKVAQDLLWNQFKYEAIKWSSSELQDACSIMRWVMVINCAVIAIQILSWTWKQYTQFVMDFTRRKNLGIHDEIDIHHWINKLFKDQNVNPQNFVYRCNLLRKTLPN
jgi:hypothetical protein